MNYIVAYSNFHDEYIFFDGYINNGILTYHYYTNIAKSPDEITRHASTVPITALKYYYEIKP
jgi:hypothetical protein